MKIMHATAVAYQGRGVLIIGGAGAGKSGMALQLLAYGATLVADDAVEISPKQGKLIASCPPSIKGMIEARRVGLLSVTSIEQVELDIIVDLDKSVEVRMPPPRTKTILGVKLAEIAGKGVPNISAVIWCMLTGGQIVPTE